MIIPIFMFSGVNTTVKINIGHQESTDIESWYKKRGYMRDFSTNLRSSYIHRLSNNRSYHSSSTTTEEFKSKGNHRHLTENTNEPLKLFLLQNKINSMVLNGGLFTKTNDIIETIEKLKNYSKLLSSNCKIDLKPIVEIIRKSLNTTIGNLQLDWNTLNNSLVQEICVSKGVNEEISNVQHILYKLIEIFYTIVYRIDSIIKEEKQILHGDIYGLFKNLFLERFSILESFTNFKNLEDIITHLLHVARN